VAAAQQQQDDDEDRQGQEIREEGKVHGKIRAFFCWQVFAVTRRGPMQPANVNVS
jgi:hypothetical protein